ncbi:MAG: inositol monophosphatase [Peptococcaceae bacterium]|nr:inositol monophosphatase [Peptococcaceae bacterium]
MKDRIRAVEKASGIVVSAGKIIREKLGGQFLTGYKSCPADLVTEVDRQSQSLIVERLGRAFPGHRLVAEEDFIQDDLDLDDRPAWFIDPLDGTTNFVFGIPVCSVTVSLAEGGKPILGVTYDPFREEIFTAVEGEGSFLNGKRIRVDGTRGKLADSLITTGFPSSEKFKGEMLRANFARIFYKAADVRALGSAALELAYIACGRITGYWEAALRPWDVAAGILLVEGAGGKVTDFYGNRLVLGNRVSIVASNSLIHEELLSDLGFLPDPGSRK